jgi:ABC-type transport system substrate-binding protein
MTTNHEANMLKHAVIPFLVGAGLLASAPFASAATNLVFCSEGSPAGFDPGQYTTGTDFDASAETMFNRLTQFERGGTAVIPGLATSWDISDGLITPSTCVKASSSTPPRTSSRLVSSTPTTCCSPSTA